MKTMTIGQVAKISGVGIETIRFYERNGLLAKPARKESGYRQFTAESVDRLNFIQRGKQLGFTLSEIRELLSLEVKPGTTKRDIKVLAQAKLNDVEEKLKMLHQIQHTLKHLIGQCDGKGAVSQCPILESFRESDTTTRTNV